MNKNKTPAPSGNWSGKVEFEDHEQDFLTWTIKAGIVVDSEPFQGWVWKGAVVHNTTISPGDQLIITTAKMGLTSIKYPVAKVHPAGGKK